GGVGVAVWLNEVQTDAGPRFFRSLSLQPRRYRDRKTGEWKDAASLRPTDVPALMLGLEAAMSFIALTPLPGQSLDDEDQIATVEQALGGDGQPVIARRPAGTRRRESRYMPPRRVPARFPGASRHGPEGDRNVVTNKADNVDFPH